MPGRSPSHRSIALLVVVALLALVHALAYLQPFDDSFITYRYAHNLVEGHGFVFNPGERVEGYSSFLWVLVLATASTVAPIFEASQVLSIGCGLGLLWLTFTWHRHARGATDGPRSNLRVVAPLWLAATGTWAYYASTGMETTLFACLLLGACLLVVPQDVSKQRALGAGALLAAAAMTRPEGHGYAVCVIAALLIAAADRRIALYVAAAFVAIYGPYFAWRYSYFGFLAPNTFYAKAVPSGALRLQGAAYLEEGLIGRGLIAGVAAACIEAKLQAASRATRIALAVIGGAIANAYLVGGDTFFFFRFLLPAMPFAYVALATVLERAAARVARPQLIAFGAASAVTCGLLVTELVVVSGFLRDRTASDFARASGNSKITEDYFLVGRFLRERARPGSLLATNAVGIVPFESGLPTLDMLGLTDVHIAHAPIELGHGVLGHEKHDAEYVMSRKPDVLLLGLPQLAPESYGPRDVERWLQKTMPYLPGDLALVTHPRFNAEYRMVFTKLGGQGLYAFVRREAATPALRLTP